jgi:hypothetical protein
MKKIEPAAIHALGESLTSAFWYKNDLRRFLTQTLPDCDLLGQLNWQEYKRTVVSQLIGHMIRKEGVYREDLVHLMLEVARISDFSHLERLDDGAAKAKTAKQAVAALRKYTAPHQAVVDEKEKFEARRAAAEKERSAATVFQRELEELKANYLLLLIDDPQRRGFALEKLLRRLFELFDLDPKASFRIVGEQIDGAFTFDSTDYLFEAKWQKEMVAAEDLDSLAGKLGRKLDNTLGLFLSINGFSQDGVAAYSSGRKVMILMDGADLIAVLEGRIDFVDLELPRFRGQVNVWVSRVDLREPFELHW